MPLLIAVADTFDWEEYRDQLAAAYTVLFSVIGPVLLFAVASFFQSQSARWSSKTHPAELLAWGLGWLVALVFALAATVYAAVGVVAFIEDPPSAIRDILLMSGIATGILVSFHIFTVARALISALPRAQQRPKRARPRQGKPRWSPMKDSST